MYRPIKELLLLPLIALSAVTYAQSGQPPVKSADSAATRKSTIKPYKEIIPTRAISKWGMFGVHKVDEKYFFEIPDSLLSREILIASRLVKTPVGSFMKFPGEIVNSKVIGFENGPGDRLFLKVYTMVTVADSNDAISKAVKNASADPIVNVFDIKAIGVDNKTKVIDVTDFFKNENIISGFSADIKNRMRLGGLAADRSYLVSMNAYPQNIEVKSLRTYTAGGPGAPAAGGEGAAAEAGGDAGAMTLELSTSLLLLPKEPMAKRLADPRIGYFDQKYTVFADNQQKVEEVTFINRHRLEPKPEDVEKYKAGQLVEPQKPIVFYVDPATPKQWRPFIISGINQWQKAFEAAGFKNAIIGKEWPENDTTMSLEDMRYFVVRYLPSQTPNAYGSQITDPRSGEVLYAFVGWYHNIMRILHDFYFMQAGALDPQGRGMKFNDTLMGKLIKVAVTHEVGHTLGLAHNMGSSSTIPVENMRDQKWLEQHGYTPSIMDYARFNYVAQPEDHISQDNLMPRMGEYDLWAIKWGYTWMDNKDEKAEKKLLAQWITDSLKANPRLWFGGEGGNNDPRAQAEDLGDNSIKASEYGMKNLKRVTANLNDWTKEEYEPYENIMTMYDKVGAEYRKYLEHVLANIGGVYENIKAENEDGNVYTPVPKSIQKDAVAFLNKEAFQTPTWMLNKDILNKFRKPGREEWPSKIQESILNLCLSTGKLNQILLNEKRFGTDKAYTIDEYLTDLERGLFSEIYAKQPMDNNRRGLQKRYVAQSIFIIKMQARTQDKPGDTPDFGSTDMVATLLAHLNKLNAACKLALPLATDAQTKYHLQYLSDYITESFKK